MLGSGIKRKINIICIIVFIIGMIAGVLLSGYKDIVQDVINQLDNNEEITDIQWAAIRDGLHGKEIHCDYCGGYVFDKYKLEQNIPDIWVYRADDIYRAICEPCKIRAMIKIFDKVLKPKYLKKRLKE